VPRFETILHSTIVKSYEPLFHDFFALKSENGHQSFFTLVCLLIEVLKCANLIYKTIQVLHCTLLS